MAAKEHSMDISAKIEMQFLKDAIMQAQKEVANRYDFKGTTFDISLNEGSKTLELLASSDNKLEALEDILIAKLLKHQLSSKVLEEKRIEDASGGNKKKTFAVVDYIEAKEAKKIVADIKKLKLKVTAQIEGDAIRVKSKQIDDLQKVIKAVKQGEYEAPLLFINMR